MVASFDFIFVWAHITVMHVCVYDALTWMCKCFAVFSCWMWITWAITMDALTPDMRKALGLRQQHLIFVVSIFLFLVVALVIELTFLQWWSLQDRYLFQVKVLGTTIDVQVFQIFFSCLISSLPMCLRILWRLHSAKNEELILIHGAVEYDDVRWPRDESVSVVTQKKPKGLTAQSRVRECSRGFIDKRKSSQPAQHETSNRCVRIKDKLFTWLQTLHSTVSFLNTRLH